MPKKIWLTVGGTLLFCFYCRTVPQTESPPPRVRAMIDTVGYAHTAPQMDSMMQRIDRAYRRERENLLFIHNIKPQDNWYLVICPHDDYRYAGEMYTFALKNLRTPVVVVFGVAHQAKKWQLEDQLIFDSHDAWSGPYGPTTVSALREDLLAELPPGTYQVHDSLQQEEHSVEAILPFLQHYQPEVEIVPILVPYMNFNRMEQLATSVAKGLSNISSRRGWIWGRDYAMVISNDCVHYGDQGWEGKDYAPYGADTSGYHAATNYDMNIISECLIDQLEPQGIRRFFEYTVNINDYKQYAWTWCGRYSVPLGLLTAYHLHQLSSSGFLQGRMLRYSTSISKPPLPVQDLGLGVTAPANIHHWVGYAAIGFRPF